MQLKAKSTHNQKESAPIPVIDSTPRQPNPEVPEKKPRRRLTTKYKIRILSEIEACTQPVDVRAILRKEGLYYSSISK